MAKYTLNTTASQEKTLDEIIATWDPGDLPIPTKIEYLQRVIDNDLAGKLSKFKQKETRRLEQGKTLDELKNITVAVSP